MKAKASREQLKIIISPQGNLLVLFLSRINLQVNYNFSIRNKEAKINDNSKKYSTNYSG
jgi:hypothetical protein